jgi:hypothetical protein
MADWVKCTRYGSDETIFLNLDHAYKIEQQGGDRGTATAEGNHRVPSVVEWSQRPRPSPQTQPLRMPTDTVGSKMGR